MMNPIEIDYSNFHSSTKLIIENPEILLSLCLLYQYILLSYIGMQFLCYLTSFGVFLTNLGNEKENEKVGLLGDKVFNFTFSETLDTYHSFYKKIKS